MNKSVRRKASTAPERINIPVGDLRDWRVSVCHNLRLDEKGVLCGVGAPLVIAENAEAAIAVTQASADETSAATGGAKAAAGGMKVIAGGTYVDREGEVCRVVYRQGSLGVLRSGLTETVAALGRCPEGAVAIDGDIVTMSEGESPRRWTRTAFGTWEERDLTPLFQSLSLQRRDMATVSVETPSISLKSSYSTSSRHLTGTDQAILDRCMRDWYREGAERAMMRGRFVQPVVARYQLTGSRGEVLYTSAPVMVCPDAGCQGTRVRVTMNGDGMRLMQPSALTMTEFEVVAVADGEPDSMWSRLVKGVRVIVSPQLHPWSASLPGSSVRVSATAGQMVMELVLPGVDREMAVAAAGTRLRGWVESILSAGEEAMYVGAAPTLQADLARMESVVAAARRLWACPADETAAMLRPPHRFAASVAAVSGHTVAWGGLTALPFGGYELTQMLTEHRDAAGQIPTAVEVTMRDGSSVVAQSVLHTRAAAGVSPLLAYPSGAASAITLMAGTRWERRTLSPTPCGLWAYSLEDDLRPLTLTQERAVWAVPVARTAPVSLPDVVAVADVSDPLRLTAVCRAGVGGVRGIAAAMRHSSSWTLPTGRFYASGPGGTAYIALNEARGQLRVNMADGRGVDSAEAMTVIPGGIAALAGGALIALTGSVPSTLLADAGAAVRLAWHAPAGELWCIHEGVGDECQAEVVSLLTGARYTRTLPSVASLCSTGAGLTLGYHNGDVADGWTLTDSRVTMIYCAAVPFEARQATDVSLCVPFWGEVSTARVRCDSLQGIAGGGRRNITSLTYHDGAPTHALVWRMRVPHGHGLETRIEAVTSRPTKVRIGG
ncbi:MAG: hypothetical protein K2K92_05880 [Duncaniella sp.]|nr:hypothetical protein [Duncaniella sp.]